MSVTSVRPGLSPAYRLGLIRPKTRGVQAFRVRLKRAHPNGREIVCAFFTGRGKARNVCAGYIRPKKSIDGGGFFCYNGRQRAESGVAKVSACAAAA